MASLYQKRTKYYIDYTLNGKKKTMSTDLEYNTANHNAALRRLKEIEVLEKKNKLMIQHGIIDPREPERKISLADAIALYLPTIKKVDANGDQDNHSRTFEVVMKQFCNTVKPSRPITSISHLDMKNFINSCTARGNSKETMRTYLAYLRGFFNYLLEIELLEKSPLSKRMFPQSEIKNVVIFDTDSITAIFDRSRKKDKQLYRIFKMLLLTGARPCDLLRLKADDIDMKGGTYNLQISKTSRQIILPIYDELYGFIKKDLKLNTIEGDQLLFEGYSVVRIGKCFRRILCELKIDKRKRYNLKTFRKTFASEFAGRGLSDGDIADLLGHTSTSTTRKYYKRMNVDALRERMNKLR